MHGDLDWHSMLWLSKTQTKALDAPTLSQSLSQSLSQELLEICGGRPLVSKLLFSKKKSFVYGRIEQRHIVWLFFFLLFIFIYFIMIQWIPFFLRKTLNSCWPKTYGKKRYGKNMKNHGMVCPPPQNQKEDKNPSGSCHNHLHVDLCESRRRAHSPIGVSFECPYQHPPWSPVSIGKPAPKIHQWTIYFCRWGFRWVDKAQCFRSAWRFGATGSSPDISRVFHNMALLGLCLELSFNNPPIFWGLWEVFQRHMCPVTSGRMDNCVRVGQRPYACVTISGSGVRGVANARHHGLHILFPWWKRSR